MGTPGGACAWLYGTGLSTRHPTRRRSACRHAQTGVARALRAAAVSGLLLLEGLDALVERLHARLERVDIGGHVLEVLLRGP
jgi:hypothetical protein